MNSKRCINLLWLLIYQSGEISRKSGVDTVVELSKRDAENLHAKILEINREKKLVRKPPTLEQVKNWIEQAKKLPRKVEY